MSVTFVLSGGASLGAVQVGMLRDNTPLSHAVALGAREIYVLPTGGPCELTAAPRGALAMVLHATGLMVAQRFAAEAVSLAGRADVVVLPPPCPIRVHPMTSVTPTS